MKTETPLTLTSLETLVDILVERIMSKIDERLEPLSERLDAIDVRLSEMDLDTGDGFERKDYEY